MDRKPIRLLSKKAVAIAALAVCACPPCARAQKIEPNIMTAPGSFSSAPTPAVTPTQAYGDPTPPATPLNPFSASLLLLSGPVSAGSTGPGQLNVTSIILTNFDTSPQQVFIFEPVFAAGGKCGDPVQAGSTPRMQVYVQPSQTMVMPFPTPLVFKGLARNCLAAEVTTELHGGSVELDVTGYYQLAR